MAYTLLSMVGTGIYLNEATHEKEYRKTRYLFPDGKEYTTRIFLEALTESHYREIEKIILVGTKTSNWGALIAEKDYETEGVFELYGRLYEGDKAGTGIADKDKEPLEQYLGGRFSVPVKLCISEPLIDDSTAHELFALYSSLKSEIKDESDILFDITHSFRSIPLLVYQALQFSFGGTQSRRNVELVYGEFVATEKVSKVRNLHKYWEFAQAADALDLFSSKLDGFRLAELVMKDWEKGGKAIKNLSEIVQTNFALQIFDVARQVRNALAVYPENAPAWLGKVKAELETIASIIDEVDKAASLLRYSEYLYARKLNVQAIITLQVAVETAVVMKYGSEDKLGDYDWWQSNGKEILRQMKGENWKEMGNPLKNLERFRNQVAHGGGMDSYTKAYPQAANIPSIYESGRRGVKQLLAILAEA